MNWLFIVNKKHITQPIPIPKNNDCYELVISINFSNKCYWSKSSRKNCIRLETMYMCGTGVCNLFVKIMDIFIKTQINQIECLTI